MTKARAHEAEFRFYEELNDFLPDSRRKRPFAYRFNGRPTVKDAVEALGAPHAEVDLILINGASAGWDEILSPGDRVSVYPMFESLDISSLTRLRPEPLRRPAFVLDVHLGKLARWMRMLGLDCRWENDLDDPEIVEISVAEGRTILTRDVGLLRRGRATRGHWVRSTDPDEQLSEVLSRFDLFDSLAPFTRCVACNGALRSAEKAEVVNKLPPRTRRYFDEFFQCENCGKVYWKGAHWAGLRERVESALAANEK
ncbi:MAG: Mut7-C RNAse domain-containing protein [Desulfococcaceae bacterium]